MNFLTCDTLEEEVECNPSREPVLLCTFNNNIDTGGEKRIDTGVGEFIVNVYPVVDLRTSGGESSGDTS